MPVLDNIQDRGGLGGITPAFSYHAARDMFPHNPSAEGAGARSRASSSSRPTRPYDGLRIQAPRQRARPPRATCSPRPAARRRRAGIRRARLDDLLPHRPPGRASGLRHPQRLRRPLPVRPLPGEPRRPRLCASRSSPTSRATTIALDLRRVAPLPRARARLPPRALLHRARSEGPATCSGSASASTASRGASRRVDGRPRAAGRARGARAACSSGEAAVARASSTERPARGRRRRRAHRLPRRAGGDRDVARGGGAEVAAAAGKPLRLHRIRAAPSRATRPGARRAAPAAEIAWRLGRRPRRARRAWLPGVDVMAYAADVDRVRLDLDAYRERLGGRRRSRWRCARRRPTARRRRTWRRSWRSHASSACARPTSTTTGSSGSRRSTDPRRARGTA